MSISTKKAVDRDAIDKFADGAMNAGAFTNPITPDHDPATVHHHKQRRQMIKFPVIYRLTQEQIDALENVFRNSKFKSKQEMFETLYISQIMKMDEQK